MCVSVCVCVCMYVCVNVRLCFFVCVGVCLSVSMCIVVFSLFSPLQTIIRVRSCMKGGKNKYALRNPTPCRIVGVGREQTSMHKRAEYTEIRNENYEYNNCLFRVNFHGMSRAG